MNTIRFADFIQNSAQNNTPDYVAGILNDTTVKSVVSGGGGGAFVPLAGTATGSQLTGTIEYLNSVEAYLAWANSDISQGYYIGVTDTTKSFGSRLYFDSPLTNADGIILNTFTSAKDYGFKTDNHASYLYYNNLTTNYLTQLQLNSGNQMAISSTSPAFQGLQYNVDYSANFIGLSLINKDYADATYAPISGSAYLPLTGGTMTGTIQYEPVNPDTTALVSTTQGFYIGTGDTTDLSTSTQGANIQFYGITEGGGAFQGMILNSINTGNAGNSSITIGTGQLDFGVTDVATAYTMNLFMTGETFQVEQYAGVAFPGIQYVGAITLANVVANQTGASILHRDANDLRYLQTALTNTHILVGNGTNVATSVALSGDATLANTGAMTLATVNSNTGTFTNATITVDAKGRITAASNGSGGGGGVSTVSGTSGRIAVTGTTSVTVDIDAAYVGQSSITTLGTITTGTWDGTAIDATHGGTGQTVYAVGDILYASTTSALSRLASNTVGKFLRAGGAGTAPTWSTLILPNAISPNQIPYATSVNTYGSSASLIYNTTSNTFGFGVNTANSNLVLGGVGASTSTTYLQRDFTNNMLNIYGGSSGSVNILNTSLASNYMFNNASATFVSPLYVGAANTPTEAIQTNGNLYFDTLGMGLKIKTGGSNSGSRAGIFTMTGGTVTFTNSTLTSNSIIVLTPIGTGVGVLNYLITGTSVTVSSSNVADGRSFSYLIIELV